MELIELHLYEEVAVKEIFCDSTPEKLLLVEGRDVQNFSHFLQISNANPHNVWVYLLYCCESVFSNMNFIKYELRSV